MNGKTAKLLRKYASTVNTPETLNGDPIEPRRPDHVSYTQKKYDALKEYWKRKLNHKERAKYREKIKDELEDRYGVFVPGRNNPNEEDVA